MKNKEPSNLNTDELVSDIHSSVLGQEIVNKDLVTKFFNDALENISEQVSADNNIKNLLSLCALEVDKILIKIHQREKFYNVTLPAIVKEQTKELQDTIKANDQAIEDMTDIYDGEAVKEKAHAPSLISSRKEITRLTIDNISLEKKIKMISLNSKDLDVWVNETGTVKAMHIHNLDSNISNLVKLFKLCGLGLNVQNIKSKIKDVFVLPDLFGDGDV